MPPPRKRIRGIARPRTPQKRDVRYSIFYKVLGGGIEHGGGKGARGGSYTEFGFSSQPVRSLGWVKSLRDPCQTSLWRIVPQSVLFSEHSTNYAKEANGGKIRQSELEFSGCRNGLNQTKTAATKPKKSLFQTNTEPPVDL